MTAATVAACVLCGAASADPLTATQRRVADELVSVFENSTTHLQYGYVENLHDGCGLTAGRAGFCSATGDMLMTVEAYAEAAPQTPLVRYLPILRARATTGARGRAGSARTSSPTGARPPKTRRFAPRRTRSSTSCTTRPRR